MRNKLSRIEVRVPETGADTGTIARFRRSFGRKASQEQATVKQLEEAITTGIGDATRDSSSLSLRELKETILPAC